MDLGLAKRRDGWLIDLVPARCGAPVVRLPGDDFPTYELERIDPDLWRIVMRAEGLTEDEVEVYEEDGLLVVRAEAAAPERRFHHEFALRDGFALDDWELEEDRLVIYLARDPAPGVAAEPPRMLVQGAEAEALAVAA